MKNLCALKVRLKRGEVSPLHRARHTLRTCLRVVPVAAALVKWSDDFSVKNKLIDAQHKELLCFTNELYEACQNGGFNERISFIRTVQNAVNYTKEQFSTEEKLMRQTTYPDYARHKSEYDMFVAEVLKQIKQLDDIQHIHGESFVHFLKDWILNHIAVSDKTYIPYIAD